MLPYVDGGKSQHAVAIASVLCRNTQRHYCEPFAGMFRVGTELLMCDSYSGRRFKHVTLVDTKREICAFWEAVLRHNWRPDTETPVTDAMWRQLRQGADRANAQHAFWGYVLGYYGAFFAGNRPRVQGHKAQQRLFGSVCCRIEQFKQHVNPDTVEVLHGDALDARTFDPQDAVVYCDPPYYEAKNISWSWHNQCRMWEAMRRWTATGSRNAVYLSAMDTEPRGGALFGLSLVCVYTKTHRSMRGKHRTEYVFCVQPRPLRPRAASL